MKTIDLSFSVWSAANLEERLEILKNQATSRPSTVGGRIVEGSFDDEEFFLIWDGDVWRAGYMYTQGLISEMEVVYEGCGETVIEALNDLVTIFTPLNGGKWGG